MRHQRRLGAATWMTGRGSCVQLAGNLCTLLLIFLTLEYAVVTRGTPSLLQFNELDIRKGINGGKEEAEMSEKCWDVDGDGEEFLEYENLCPKDVVEFTEWRKRTRPHRTSSGIEEKDENKRRFLRNADRWTGKATKFMEKKEEKKEEDELDLSSIDPLALKEEVKLFSQDQKLKYDVKSEFEDIISFRFFLWSQIEEIREYRTTLEAILAKENEIEEKGSEKTKGGDVTRGNADSAEWWVDRLKKSQMWEITKNYQGLPGVHILQEEEEVGERGRERESSPPSFLLIESACNLGPGIWYSQNIKNFTRATDNLGIYGGMLGRHGRFLTEKEKKAEKISVPNEKMFKSCGLVISDDGKDETAFQEIGALAEISFSLEKSLNSSEFEGPLPDLQIYMSLGSQENSWMETTAKMLFGDNRKTQDKEISGPVCFKELIFPLNKVFPSGGSASRLRQLSHAAISKAYLGFMAPIKADPWHQVTWIWNRERYDISNREDFHNMLFRVFKDRPIGVITWTPTTDFLQMVDVMRRSTVLILPCGSSLIPFFFLPPGASVLELSPPQAESFQVQNVARKLGLHYLRWTASDWETKDVSNGGVTGPVNIKEVEKILRGLKK